jgi:hypothetical protein
MSNSTYILVLIALLVIWSLFGKRILGFLLTRGAAQGVLKNIGAKALDSQPEWITLQQLTTPQWRNAVAIAEWTKPLLAGGFQDAGVFAVDKMPGVKVNILVKPADFIMANVYEHPRAGTWIELVTNYENGSVTTLTTMKPTGLERPAWITTIFAQDAAPIELVRRLIRERRPGAMIAISAQRAPKQFEEGYAKYMVWRKNSGLSVEEAGAVVKKWAAGQGVGQ